MKGQLFKTRVFFNVGSFTELSWNFHGSFRKSLGSFRKIPGSLRKIPGSFRKIPGTFREFPEGGFQLPELDCGPLGACKEVPWADSSRFHQREGMTLGNTTTCKECLFDVLFEVD